MTTRDQRPRVRSGLRRRRTLDALWALRFRRRDLGLIMRAARIETGGSKKATTWGRDVLVERARQVVEGVERG